MNETLLYAVRSDLEGIDEAPLYAEFTDKESAIKYAKAHLDALPYVECLTVSLDDSGNYNDVFKLETVWVYSDAPELDEAYDDPKTEFTRKEVVNLYGQKPTRPAMYNTLYANNTGVGDIKYEELSADVIASDKVFQLDFPEYQKTARGPELVADEDIADEEEISFTAEEAVPYLIDDEEEAISSYQKAAEVVDESDLDNKKEILAAIKDIQEEEEAHLDQLKELVDEETIEEETIEEETIEEETIEEEATETLTEAADLVSFDDGGDIGFSGSTEESVPLDLEGIFGGEETPLYYDAEFEDAPSSMLPYGDGMSDDAEAFKGSLVDAGERIKGGLSSVGNTFANTGSSIAGTFADAGSNAISGVMGAVGDISSVAAMKAKLKNARLETQIEKENTAQAVQSIKTNRAKKGAEWQNVGLAKARAAAARAAAKSRLEVADIDARTAKAVAQQAPSVRNAHSELATAELQKKAQTLNAKTAKKIAGQTDDVIKSISDKKAAWNQAQAQTLNAITAKNIAKQTDDVIRATSDRIASTQDHIAAAHKNETERIKANTAKQVAKQAPEVGRAYSKKFAARQDNNTARYKNHEERVKANTTKYTALQDPKVKKAITDLETDKVRKQDTQVKTGITKELAKQNPELDQVKKTRAVQRVKIGTSELNNRAYQDQNPEAVSIKKDIQNTKLAQKLEKEKKKLQDYEQQNGLGDVSETLHENTIFKGALPKRTKEYFRMLVNDYKPTTIFTEKMISKDGFKNPFTLKTYVVVYNGQGYEVDAYSAENDLAEAVAYFQTYDEFWDYLREMISQPGIAPEYNYIFTEGLHESMVVTDAVSIQKAAVPKVTRVEFEEMLRRNGAVQVYHENPATFGSDIEDYYITMTPTGEYELISEDSRGRVDSEEMFNNYIELHAYLSKINKNPYLYIPDIIIGLV